MMFEDAISIVLLHEGGYVNDPDDPGGETNFGIAKRYHPNVDIKNLTREKAIEIYYNEYWDAKVESYPLPIQLQMFDMYVNLGATGAIKVLQRTINYVSKDANKIKVDGVYGNNTRQRLAQCLTDYKSFNCLLMGQRVTTYVDKVKQNPVKLKYLSGWVSRSIDIFYKSF